MTVVKQMQHDSSEAFAVRHMQHDSSEAFATCNMIAVRPLQ